MKNHVTNHVLKGALVGGVLAACAIDIASRDGPVTKCVQGMRAWTIDTLKDPETLAYEYRLVLARRALEIVKECTVLSPHDEEHYHLQLQSAEEGTAAGLALLGDLVDYTARIGHPVQEDVKALYEAAHAFDPLIGPHPTGQLSDAVEQCEAALARVPH